MSKFVRSSMVVACLITLGCVPPDQGPASTSTTTTSTTTTLPTSLVRHSLNFDHSCSLMSTGAIQCYGANGRGQLGNGTTTASLEATDVQSDATFTSIGEAQGLWNCAVTLDGGVKCWGYNAYGQLGDGTRTDRAVPVDVVSLEDVLEVSTGNTHACALLADRTLRCWGDSYFGELGAGAVVGAQLSPIPVVGLTDVTSVHAGNLRTCASVASGELYCWGSNTNGSLGDGTEEQRNTPVKVLGVSNVVDVELGSSGYTCALDQSAAVTCWGGNNFGAIGQGTAQKSVTPVHVPQLDGAIDIAAGYAHTCGAFEDGSVVCVGYNADGQLGDGTTTSRRTFAPVSGLAGATSVDADGYSTCADTAEGRYCWGRNTSGQLGNGETVNRSTPVAVTAVP